MMRKIFGRIIMKRTILVCALIGLLCSCWGNHSRQTKHPVNEAGVFVCAGRTAKRYHSVDDCKGLSRCSGEILEMTLEEAEEMGKTPCRMCVDECMKNE